MTMKNIHAQIHVCVNEKKVKPIVFTYHIVEIKHFLNMLCNNNKIGNCVTLLRLTPRKPGGKHRPYVPNDTETD